MLAVLQLMVIRNFTLIPFKYFFYTEGMYVQIETKNNVEEKRDVYKKKSREKRRQGEEDAKEKYKE